MTADAIDVLVVGAGPTGLTLAGELLRRGLKVRIVDSAPAATEQSRALAVHARTLEIFDDLGIADELIAAGKKVIGATFWSGGTEPIARVDFESIPSRHSYLLLVAQAETERALGRLLERRGGAVERGVQLTTLRQDGTGVTAQLTPAGGGEPTEVRAAWVVGCDGAHSTVRKVVGIPFAGDTYDEHLLLADVKIAWDVRDDRVSSWLGEEGLVACFPLAGGRWRVVGTAQRGDESKEPPALETIQAMVRLLSGTPATVSDPAWLARFRIHCRQAAHYRDDRVFLAGDAAHIHSPFGGQGMNLGIQDAHNLAWKLALVHRGDARGLLLDTYERERHAVGRAVLTTTDAATKVGILKSAPARGARDQFARLLTGFEAVQHRIAETVSEVAVRYESAIVREDATSLLNARLGSAAGGETPTLGTVREFAAGPRAGRRAPDGKVTLAGEGGTKRLLSILDARRHTVLLFDGRSASAEGYARMASIDAAVRARHPDLVDVKLVTPRSARPAELPAELSVLLDPDGELERAYAAGTECLYVVRPDLCVGYRSQPADEAKLLAWLATFLR
jgi:2-polyprenyl-6-methoxyphenol hydroxylase-like FAD-dependent oxidoreductase